MTEQRKAELFSGLLHGFDGLLDDETYYTILRGIGMTHREMEGEGLDLREQYTPRYEALDELCERLTIFVEHAADESMLELERDKPATIYLAGRACDFDIDMEGNQMLWDTVVGMLGERLSAYEPDMEIDNGELIITPRAQEMGMGM